MTRAFTTRQEYARIAITFKNHLRQTYPKYPKQNGKRKLSQLHGCYGVAVVERKSKKKKQ